MGVVGLQVCVDDAQTSKLFKSCGHQLYYGPYVCQLKWAPVSLSHEIVQTLPKYLKHQAEL